MHPDDRSGLCEYLEAFKDSTEDFLFAYSFDPDGRISTQKWGRKAFWEFARRAGGVLRTAGLVRGDRFCLCVGANQPFDLAFRLGAVMTGTVPVTINWQADTADRVAYKIRRTESRLIVIDDVFDPALLSSVREMSPDIPVLGLSELPARKRLEEDALLKSLPAEATRLIVFTSGTTAQPKGVELPYRAYRANRATFEQFLRIDPSDRFAALIVNPLHHANSSAITDWALRRPGTHLHLLPRYSTLYWKVLAAVADGPCDRIVAPTVSRHFDFLEALDRANRLPLPVAALTKAMRKVDFLIGSAPVGPATINRLLGYTGRIPAVRFGATETCLQSIGIPVAMPEEAKLRAFEKGWHHRTGDGPQPGYYIGRPHPPHTAARVVESVTAGQTGFMKDCAPGRPGYLIVSGNHLMSAYTGEPGQTRAVFHDKWYTGLKDIGYTLVSEHDGDLDFYWMSRESTMLIRGGANYAYDQINAEIKAALERRFGLKTEDFDVAVVGLKLESEHEDSCCVTVAPASALARNKLPEDPDCLMRQLNQVVSKAARADYVRFGPIPRNFKGAVLVKQLAAGFEDRRKSGDAGQET